MTDHPLIAGVELGGTKCICILATGPDDIRDEVRIPTTTPDETLGAIEATLANMREEPDGSLAQRLSASRHLSILQSMWNNPPNRYWTEITAPVRMLAAIPKGVDRGWAERIRSRVTATATTMRRATVHEYPDSDHDLHAQRPEQVAGELLDLARETTSSTTGR